VRIVKSIDEPMIEKVFVLVIVLTSPLARGILSVLQRTPLALVGISTHNAMDPRLKERRSETDYPSDNNNLPMLIL
jgi:hypothetical protein